MAIASKPHYLAILISASFCILIHPAPHLCTTRQLQLDEQPAIMPNRKKVVAVAYGRRSEANHPLLEKLCGDRGDIFIGYKSNPYAELNIFSDSFVAYQSIYSSIRSGVCCGMGSKSKLIRNANVIPGMKAIRNAENYKYGFGFKVTNIEVYVEINLLICEMKVEDAERAIFDIPKVQNSDSYLRDILGDILGKDMYYPLTHGAAHKQQQRCILNQLLFSTINSNLKKEEYDIWAMEMEHYLEYIDNEVWKVIQNGNSKKRISTGKDGIVRVLSPVTAAEIKLFGGNANSKKMQKAVFKQQFEALKYQLEGLEKGYDRFQQLLSQLEAHSAEVSTEDANHKFLRSLPPAWSNLAMTMRTNPEIDIYLLIDRQYLRVFEQEFKVRGGFQKTSSSAQNVAFVSQSKSSTNKVKSGFSSAYSSCTPSTSSTNIPEKEVLAGFADEVIYSLFAKQSEDWDLLHEDLEQIDDVDIEEMDINWQIAMIAIRMKKFYKKTGRRVRVDGKTPVGFDKKKLESGKQEKNQMGLLTMDDGIVNWGEHTEAEETNHALMAISSSNEVTLCSKTCIDSYNTLKTLCDEQMNQLGDQEAQILAYSKAVKKLEAQLENRNESCQAKEQLQKIVDSWKDSSKNLWRLINSGMSSNDKLGLGFEIQSNDEVLSYEEEMNFSVFKCSKEDSIGKPSYSRFTKTNDFKGVLPPLSGDYTPKPQEKIDDSLYVYGKQGPQKPKTSVSDDNSSEHSTCQSNDSGGSCGNTSEHSFETESESLSKQNEMSKSRLEVTNEKDVSAPKSKEVEPSCVSHIKTPRQPLKDKETHKVNRKNWNDMMERELGEGYSFTKKKCFVCGSLNHLIKDCDYYEKKMAREAEVKRVVNTGNGVAKPVWTNANRVNHANKFVPRSVQLNTGRPKLNSVRPNINTGRTNINSVRPKVNAVSPKVNTVRSKQPVPNKTSNSSSPKRPQMNQMNQRRDFSKSYSSVRRPFANSTAQMANSNAVMGRWGSAVKTSASYNWRNNRPNFHYNSNKDQLEDFEEFNGGSVTFGGSKGYISGKGRIRVGNLDFDSVSFVKELGHFNLFSISQICDKQHKVLFTETECLVVSSDFKMPDENQILLKVPRHHNMYSFDMKTPSPAKGFACLIAKATSDESKLWHRRFSWVFFLASKDETSGILQTFIRQIENQLSHRVKIIRSDNGTEFKNRDMLEFCGNKGIKQEYSNARTPQQNGVAERMNRTLIEAARTMLADSLLPTTFWAEAVSTACYIFNRVRVTKPQNKTPYELLFGHKPIISYIRPFGCHVTILDTLSVLGKFDGKSDEGFLVGYSLNSKAYRVYNLVTKRVEVNLHVNFLEDKPNVKGVGYRWMFDIDYLTDSMNYIPVSLENQANPHAGASEVTNSAGTPTSIASEEKDEEVELIVVPSAVKVPEEKDESRKSSTNSKKEETLTEPPKEKKDSSTDSLEDNPKIQAFRRELEEIALKHLGTVPENNTTSTPSVNTGSQTVNTGRLDHDDSLMPELEIFHKPETGIFDEASYDEEGVITDFNSLPTEIEVSPTPTLRIHSIHPKSQILGDPKSAVQTRSKVQNKSGAHALLSHIQKQQRNNHKDQQHCLFACFLSQEEPKKIAEALQDDSWVQAMQEELLQFKLQQVWVLVDLPHGMKGITILLEAFSDSDYGGSNLDRKSTTGGCQFLRRNTISWQWFAEIVDFLRGSNLRYALTTNPTIYDALVKQFWQTATANTKADGSLEIKATIDTIGYTITEASIRDSLQLEDATGITMLPNDELFEGMGQIGYPTDGTFTFWKSFFTPQWRYLVHHLLHCISSKSGGWDQFGSNIATALICLSTGQEHDAVAPSKPSSPTPPVPSTSSPQHIYEEPSPVQQHFSPPQEQAPSQMSMDDLLQAVPKMISRIDSLETDLKQTKLTMGNAIVKLVKKVKKLEGFLKRRNLVLSDSEEEEPEVQGRKSQDDPLDSSIQGLVTPSTKVNASGEEQVEDISPNTLEAQPQDLSQIGFLFKAKSDLTREGDTRKKEAKEIRTKEKEKLPMDSKDTPKKSKEQIPTRWKLAFLKQSDCMLGSEVQGEDFAKKMVDLVNQRKKYFAEERARAKRNKPMTQSHAETLYDDYLKESKGHKATKASLKRYGEDFIQIPPKRLKDDEAKDDEPTKKSGKRRKQMARRGLHTNSDKDDSVSSDEVSEQDDSVTGTQDTNSILFLKSNMKTPSIATYKIIKQGEKGVYQIVREDGTDIVYINFGAMLKSISRDDLTELYRIVMNRYGMNGPEIKLEKGVNTPGSDENRLKLYDLVYIIFNVADMMDC
ncbi:putative ribonuclease H-like domain-containing protein [Tanacetum coccineum]